MISVLIVHLDLQILGYLLFCSIQETFADHLLNGDLVSWASQVEAAFAQHMEALCQGTHCGFLH